MKTFTENSPNRRPAATPTIQTKLNIGKPNDRYEKEADNVADKVVNQSAAPQQIQTKCDSCSNEEKVQRMAKDEEVQAKPISTIQKQDEEEVQAKPLPQIQRQEEELQAKSETGPPSFASQAVSDGISSSKGSGTPLPVDIRTQMETGIGADFSKVRIHTDSRSANMNQELQARAFTTGNNVYFNKGQYSPGSKTGKHLLAHELTHTVQQSRNSTMPANRISRKEEQFTSFTKGAQLFSGSGDKKVDLGMVEPGARIKVLEPEENGFVKVRVMSGIHRGHKEPAYISSKATFEATQTKVKSGGGINLVLFQNPERDSKDKKDYEKRIKQRRYFFNTSLQMARSNKSTFVDPRTGKCSDQHLPIEYFTAEDIEQAIIAAGKCTGQKVKDVVLIGHGGLKGIYGSGDSNKRTGLYPDKVHKDQLKDILAAQPALRGVIERLADEQGFVPAGFAIQTGGRTISKLVSNTRSYLSSDVQIKLYACKTVAKPGKPDGVAQKLAQELHKQGLDESQVIGNEQSGHVLGKEKGWRTLPEKEE